MSTVRQRLMSTAVTFAALTESWSTVAETALSRHHGCPVTAITVTRSDGQDSTDVRRPGARSFGRREVDSEGSQSRRKSVWKSVQHVFDEFVLPRLPER